MIGGEITSYTSMPQRAHQDTEQYGDPREPVNQQEPPGANHIHIGENPYN
jgi:hypothetical protein